MTRTTARTADLARRAGPAVVRETESLAPGMQVVADVLAELIPLWDCEAMDDVA